MSAKIRFITKAAIIAAVYVVLVVVWPFSSGVVQVRLAEALTVLPYFTAAAIPGVTLGCLTANILTGCAVYDVIFGTLATFVGAVVSYKLRRVSKLLVPVPPIIANTLIVPFILRYVYAIEGSIPFFMLTVGAGEVISCGVIGIALLLALERLPQSVTDSVTR
jgi:uncharacterized membrane protein